MLAITASAMANTADFTPDEVCQGTNTTFVSTSTASGGATIVEWQWDFSGGTAFTDASGPTVNQLFPTAGTFNVGLRIITDMMDTVAVFKLITVNPLPNAVFSIPDVCEDGVSQMVDASTVDAPSTIVAWNWDTDNDGNYDNGSGSSFSTVLGPAGNYVVGLQVITDAGCVSTTTSNAVVHPSPTIDFSTQQMCHGDTSMLMAIGAVSTGSIVSYDWELNGDGMFNDMTGENITHQFINPGSHIIGVMATTDQGCTADTLRLETVSPLPLPIFSFDDACVNTPVDFTNQSINQVGSVTYSWSFGSSGSSTDPNPTHIFTMAGTYSIQLLAVNSYGCKDSTVQQIEILPAPIADFSATEECQGVQNTFTNLSQANGTTISDYYWDFQDQNVSAAENPVHLYFSADSFNVSLVVTSTDGCRDTAENWVYVWPNPVPVITPQGPTSFCDGETVDLMVNQDDNTVFWSTTESTETITVDSLGNYDVLLVSPHGCEGRTEIDIVVWELPTLTVSNDTLVSLGNEVPLSVEGATFYDWSPPDFLDDPGIDQPESDPQSTITYTVTGTDDNGCVNTAEMTITVVADYDLYPVNLFTPNGDGVNEIFYVKNLDLYDDCTLRVYNRWGNEVYTASPYLNDWDGTFNGTALPEATYYYIIDCDGREGRFDGTVSILRLN